MEKVRIMSLEEHTRDLILSKLYERNSREFYYCICHLNRLHRGKYDRKHLWKFIANLNVDSTNSKDWFVYSTKGVSIWCGDAVHFDVNGDKYRIPAPSSLGAIFSSIYSLGLELYYTDRISKEYMSDLP